MWRIRDYSNGRIWAALRKEWGEETAGHVLERSHRLGAAMDIADELAYLGFAIHQDFEVHPAKATCLTA